jgi:hypothetical protein
VIERTVLSGLSPDALLRVWESGARQHPLDRALTILAAATPGAPWESLATETIGRRDAGLLQIHAATFGPRLPAVADCPACGATVEFVVDVAGLQATLADARGEQEEHQLRCESITLVFRLPTSHTLAAALAGGNLEEARARLIDQCVVRAEQDGVALPSSALPDAVLGRLAERMSELDPGLEIAFDIPCAGCNHQWRALLDIGAYLWQEICAQARRLLRETATLARVYGWCEADILALSPARRQAYLELAP